MRNGPDPHVWRGLALPLIVVAAPGRLRREALTASRRD
jgi:MYXO-CTERM domain-containing protein